MFDRCDASLDGAHRSLFPVGMGSGVHPVVFSDGHNGFQLFVHKLRAAAVFGYAQYATGGRDFRA